RTIPAIEVHCGPRGFHLFERHSFLNHVLNAVADHRHHIPVRRHIADIRKPASAGYNPSAALGHIFGGGHVENAVESIDDPLDAAAFLDVNDRIACRPKEVSRAYDLRPSKEYQAVAVSVRGRHVIKKDGLTVEVLMEPERLAEISVRRPRAVRQRLHSAGRTA